MTRPKVKEIEEGWKDWGNSIAFKVGDRNYLSILKNTSTHPLLEVDILTATLFDFEELDEEIPPVGWLKIWLRIQIEKLRDVDYYRYGYAIEFTCNEDVEVYKQYLRTKSKRSYVI